MTRDLAGQWVVGVSDTCPDKVKCEGWRRYDHVQYSTVQYSTVHYRWDTNLIVTENCIWQFWRRRASFPTSSPCCRCRCGSLHGVVIWDNRSHEVTKLPSYQESLYMSCHLWNNSQWRFVLTWFLAPEYFFACIARDLCHGNAPAAVGLTRGYSWMTGGQWVLVFTIPSSSDTAAN